MKRITNLQATVSNGKITMTGDIEDYNFEHPVQRVTVTNHVASNMAWPRHCQISHEAYFVKAFGNGVGIMHNDLVAIAVAVEPKISFLPLFRNRLTPALSLDIVSELPVTVQWETSTDAKTWTPIAGATGNSIDPKTITKRDFVRCVATNAAGSTTSDPVMVQ